MPFWLVEIVVVIDCSCQRIQRVLTKIIYQNCIDSGSRKHLPQDYTEKRQRKVKKSQGQAWPIIP